MLTLKFYKADEDESFCSIFDCNHYLGHYRKDGSITIVIYKDHIETSGVDVHISKEKDDYNICYIENDAGKTIETYSWNKISKLG